MGESYGKIVSYLIAIIFMTLVPTMLILQKSDDMVQGYVDHITQRYVDKVRETGIVSEKEYQEFIEDLAKTGYGYTINMTCEKEDYYPATNTGAGVIQLTGGYEQVTMPTGELEIENTLTNTTDGIYRMNKGDYFNVEVLCKDTTISTKIFRTLTLGIAEPTTISSRYGGNIGTTAKE